MIIHLNIPLKIDKKILLKRMEEECCIFCGGSDRNHYWNINLYYLNWCRKCHLERGLGYIDHNGEIRDRQSPRINGVMNFAFYLKEYLKKYGLL